MEVAPKDRLRDNLLIMQHHLNDIIKHDVPEGVTDSVEDTDEAIQDTEKLLPAKERLSVDKERNAGDIKVASLLMAVLVNNHLRKA